MLSKMCSFLKAVSLGVVLVAIFAYFVGFLYSESDSWPQHYFLHLKRIPPRKGDLTVFWHPGRKQKLVKQIVGTAGDKVHYDQQGTLWIEQKKIGKPYTHSSKGQPLHSLPAQVISKDHVFAYSSHEQSFDSRYQEVGLVPINSLQGKVIALG